MPEIRERILDQQIPVSQQEKQKPSIMVDLQKEKEVTIPREVKTWMQKVEEDPTLTNQSQQMKGDDDSVLRPIAPAVTKIVLPTDKKVFTTGFSQPVDNAWRWLSEFILRVIKKNQGNVKFKEE